MNNNTFTDIPMVSNLPLRNIQSHNNRYDGIYPYEHNSIKIDGEYINASLIHNKYIATQAPLPNTFDKFWKMVFNYKVPMILMLTKLTENGRIKAHKYWPSELGEKKVFGDISVKLLKVYRNNVFTHRICILSNNKLSRAVHHFHYKNWPDYSIPNNSEDIHQLLNLLDKYTGIPLIHCSAGIGRTGVMVALHLKKHNGKSTYEIVEKLRKERAYMVNTENQYMFIENFNFS